MTDKGIFKYIWRINAVLVLVAGIGLSFMVLSEFAEYLGDMFTPRNKPTETKDMTLRLGISIPAGNGEFFLFPYSPGGRWEGDGAWLSEPIRNFLVVDAKTNESHWMFPDNDHHIINWREITKNEECGFLTVGLMITEVPVDTNGNGERDNGDMTRRLFSSGYRYEPKDLIGESVHFLSCEENDGRLFCQFRTRQGRESAIFALDEDMTLIDRRVLPAAPLGEGGADDG